MAKALKLTNAVDENLKLVKDEDGSDTALELSKDELRVNGSVNIRNNISVDGSWDGDLTVQNFNADSVSSDSLTLPEEGKLSWGTDDKLYITANENSSVWDMTFRVRDVDVLTATRPTANSGQVKIDAGSIGNYSSNDFDSALDVNVTLNHALADGSFVSDYSLIRGVATNTNIGTFDELYLLHLTGAAVFWVSNAGDVSLAATKKLFFDGGSSATNGHTYIAESGDDVLDIYVGALNILKLDEGNDKVEVLGADLEIDATQKLYLDGGGDTYIQESGADVLDFYVGAVNILKLTEAGGGASDKVSIPSLTPLHFDGGGDTYIAESATDLLSIHVGGDDLVRLKENGAEGNTANFRDTGVGFIQNEPTYNASDTEVNFHTAGNKQFLTFGSGNITDLNLNFPDVSCNCVLLVKQDGSGSRTITNYKTFDQAGGNESTVKFAGGSNPTLTTTANKLDIFSFYWDNDNHIAYGVVSQNF